jgi:hypothetical protein
MYLPNGVSSTAEGQLGEDREQISGYFKYLTNANKRRKIT